MSILDPSHRNTPLNTQQYSPWFCDGGWTTCGLGYHLPLARRSQVDDCTDISFGLSFHSLSDEGKSRAMRMSQAIAS